MGSSFGYSCLVQSIATAKFLRNRSKVVVLAGLSQGGFTTLLNSFFSKPDFAIVASGYSPINDSIYISGFDQFVMPNLTVNFSFQKIKTKIQNSNTRYFFSYGIDDHAFYRNENTYKRMLMELRQFGNAKVCLFKGGHMFPIDSISCWLN